MSRRPTLNSAAPRPHRLAFLTWVGVYPVLTATALAVEPVLSSQPVPLRTLVMSALMVPTMVYAVMPLIHRYLMSAPSSQPQAAGSSASESSMSAPSRSAPQRTPTSRCLAGGALRRANASVSAAPARSTVLDASGYVGQCHAVGEADARAPGLSNV